MQDKGGFLLYYTRQFVTNDRTGPGHVHASSFNSRLGFVAGESQQLLMCYTAAYK